jgi:hypothetical protein
VRRRESHRSAIFLSDSCEKCTLQNMNSCNPHSTFSVSKEESAARRGHRALVGPWWGTAHRAFPTPGPSSGARALVQPPARRRPRPQDAGKLRQPSRSIQKWKHGHLRPKCRRIFLCFLERGPGREHTGSGQRLSSRWAGRDGQGRVCVRLGDDGPGGDRSQASLALLP